MPAVVLVTDFGWRDPWVAEMKGCLLDLWRRRPGPAPDPVLVDGGHDIPPGDVAAGAWFLGRLVPRFPVGTVFLAVVDPGVGTDRPAVACGAAGRLCVGPGNGLMAAVADGPVVCLEAPPGPVSATFHGREIFAPAAGRLALGCPLELLGPAGTPADLGEPVDFGMEPAIRWIDRFGNAVSDLTRGSVDGMRLEAGARLKVAGRELAGPFVTYGAAPPERPFWYWGSGATVEIAVPGADAAASLGLEPGLVLTVVAP